MKKRLYLLAGIVAFVLFVGANDTFVSNDGRAPITHTLTFVSGKLGIYERSVRSTERKEQALAEKKKNEELEAERKAKSAENSRRFARENRGLTIDQVVAKYERIEAAKK